MPFLGQSVFVCFDFFWFVVFFSFLTLQYEFCHFILTIQLYFFKCKSHIYYLYLVFMYLC